MVNGNFMDFGVPFLLLGWHQVEARYGLGEPVDREVVDTRFGYYYTYNGF
jgi:hypothetical protein